MLKVLVLLHTIHMDWRFVWDIILMYVCMHKQFERYYCSYNKEYGCHREKWLLFLACVSISYTLKYLVMLACELSAMVVKHVTSSQVLSAGLMSPVAGRLLKPRYALIYSDWIRQPCIVGISVITTFCIPSFIQSDDTCLSCQWQNSASTVILCREWGSEIHYGSRPIPFACKLSSMWHVCLCVSEVQCELW